MDKSPVVPRQNRPGCLTLISLYYGFHGALVGVGLLFAIGFFASSTASAPLPAFNQISENLDFEWFTLMLLLIGVFIIGLALAIFFLVVAFGLWRLKFWAYRATVITSSIIVALNLIGLVVALVNDSVAGLRGLVFHGLILWGLSRDEVKNAFD